MNKERLDEAHRKLLQRWSALLHRHADDQASERELLDDPEPDWEDRAAAVTAARTLARLEEHERAEMDAIVAALERIANGSYGRCLGCGGSIEEARLRTLPETRLCSRCIDGHAHA